MRVFQGAAGDLPHHLGQHARFKHAKQAFTGGLVPARCGATSPDVMAFEPAQALSRIAEPGSPANVAIAARVTVAEKIETGSLLIGKVRRQAIAVLLAE